MVNKGVRIMGETELKDSFVSQEVQEFLSQNGWVKTYDSFEKVTIFKLYPKGLRGAQTWKKSTKEIYISFEDDGKHTFEYWYNNKDCDTYKLRNIKSTLIKKGLV